MNISISLSEGSVNKAIRKLTSYREEKLQHLTEEVVSMLAEEGADTARAAYGRWGVEVTTEDGHATEELTAKSVINVDGDMPLIAEFGAGDATLTPSSMFENEPDTEVFAGSYSLLEGSGEYWENGEWHWRGKPFTEVPARHGLYNAKQYIIANSTNVAQEVFGE